MKRTKDEQNVNLVAVYGSLMSGMANHYILNDYRPAFHGQDTTPRIFDMYDMGNYPSLVVGGRKGIQVEIYEIDDEILDALDQLEGFQGYEQPERNYYSRKIIDTEFGEAFIYIIEDITKYPNAHKTDFINWKLKTTQKEFENAARPKKDLEPEWLALLDIDAGLPKPKERIEFPTLSNIKNVTIGSDFEVFLYDKTIKDVINAKPFVKGKKEKPFNFDKSNPFWCTSLDNVLAEGNIPPTTSPIEFDNNIVKVLKFIESKLPENISILNEPAWYMNPEFLKNKEAKKFGCEASFNCYSREVNPSPDNNTTLRSSAFHLHFKYDDMDFNTSCELIKVLDLFLGVPSILMEPPNDRRMLYGKAGEFRFHEEKTMEYRVLSGFFSKNSALRTWAFKNAMKAIEFYNSGKRIDQFSAKEIIDTINNRKQNTAEKIVNSYKISLLFAA